MILGLKLVYLTNILTLGILISTPVRVVLVRKLVTLGNLFLTLFILVLRVVLAAKFVISCILSVISFILPLYI